MAGTCVVVVHGIWMNGMEMWVLRKRLQRAGFVVYPFRYPSVSGDFSTNVRRLEAFVAGIDASTVHFVAHSLGGLLLRRLFNDFSQPRAGRVVTLGTPHAGSSVARQLVSSRVGRRLLGGAREALCGDSPTWPAACPLGSIAGDRALGMGMLLSDLARPCDGTVAVAETRLEHMADHLVVHSSHFGMLFSREVAAQAIHFLHHGCFARAAN